jgi:DNA-binding PadR family transcriptional regulator
VTIRDEILTVTGRDVSVAAVYAALDRLERQQLVEPWLSAPRPERGGRARRHFRLSREGERALRLEREVMARLWDGVVLGSEPWPS